MKRRRRLRKRNRQRLATHAQEAEAVEIIRAAPLQAGRPKGHGGFFIANEPDAVDSDGSFKGGAKWRPGQ